ncbi:MAG: GumC family protein [Aeoliella sp.]
MTSSKKSIASSKTIVATLYRHKGKAILIPTLSLLTAALVILFFPRTYHSEAVLFLQVGRETVGIDPTATTGQTIALQQSGRDNEVKSTIDILRSRGVIAKTVDNMGSDVVLSKTDIGEKESNVFADTLGAVIGSATSVLKDIDRIPEREAAIIAIESNLFVNAERGSTAINVDIEADTPELAQTILTELIQVYREEHARIHRNQNSQAFFKEQHEKLKSQLDEANQAIREAKNEMGIASINGRREALEKHMHEIALAKYQTEQQLATASAHVAHLRQQVVNLPERIGTTKTTLPNEGADLLRQELYALEIRKAELNARYNDNHPLVMAISHQVSEAQKVVDAQQEDRQQTVDDVNTIHQELSLRLKQEESAVAGLDSRLETLNEQTQLVKLDLVELNEYDLRMDQLEREVNLRSTKFYKYAENLEQARIDQELEKQRISNISISQEPLLLRKPVSPSKLLVLLASVFLATAGTGAAIMASERLHEHARDEREVEDMLDMPVYISTQENGSREPVLVSK